MRDYNLLNNTNLVHTLILDLPKQPKIVVDMTCGNGHDTLFLAKNYLKVYAFDIQPSAIAKTLDKVKSFSNVKVILTDHYDFDKYLKNADLFLFNLGWLPGGNKAIETNAHNSIKTINKCLKHLNPKGNIVITSYNGNANQIAESEAIYQLVTNKENILCQRVSLLNQKNAPITWIIGLKE
ncbi:MAG: class I SAM-dependent methyltransferase [Erysipelotrichaceae bacterium]